ncbi:interferon-related developmental regulator 2 [Denticeps clupeoides]|uniref:Interferon-related developmental regulator 2 n=1 Tax=Denticeps clupeoides TaxID=299321 RepID=A0AAY4C214_9TELE|nr:interferon-related developmental regulator 2-like [Denticeps clupeoides]
MPRSKKGRRAGPSKARSGVKGESGVSDDDLASDVLSHCSSASEATSVQDEAAEVVDEQTAQEETEDKLKQSIDDLADKSVKVRVCALESLRQAFSSRLLTDFLLERHFTVGDCLERSLRKGGGAEQAAAATLCSLLCVQVGGGAEGEKDFKTIGPVLGSILIDSCANLSARRSCARALGMCCYVSAAEDAEDLLKALAQLEGVFSSAYPLVGGALPTVQAGTPPLHTAALQAWALLTTLCPSSHLSTIVQHHLPRLQACLESSDVHFRIAVGETIALLYEMGRDIDQDYEYENRDALCEALKGLATDGNKHRAKNDRRKQRSIFREVLHYIENEDFSEERVRFGAEVLYIDCWVRRRIYEAFKDVLESGTLHHLQWNPLLRDVFGLGSPLILDTSVKSSKISRVERHLFNAAAFKARTKLRNKVRDKRADVM